MNVTGFALLHPKGGIIIVAFHTASRYTLSSHVASPKALKTAPVLVHISSLPR